MINVVNLSKSYGNKRVLDNVSFNVKTGEIFALLGVNGAGKTTTLECLEGIRKPDCGQLSINGLDVDRDRKEIQKILGVQLQNSGISGNMPVLDTMKMFCAWKGVPTRVDLLRQFGLQDQLKQPYSSLSAGQKRRLQLALSLCHNPQVVILDEPTAGLDVEGRYALHQEIMRLKKNGITIILASHDMDEVQLLCDRIAFLKEGRIVKEGTPRELTACAMSTILFQTEKKSMKSPTTLNIHVLEDGYFSILTNDTIADLEMLFSYMKAEKDVITDLRVERAGLETLFLNIAGGK
jgi:ABC-2 type transport system ATP-binding protein